MPVSSTSSATGCEPTAANQSLSALRRPAAVHQIRSNGAQLQALLDELIAKSDRPAG